MIRYVAGFLFNPEKDKVVLVKKNKPEWQKGLYNGVGGKVEPGENIHHAMTREFKEETGVYIPPYDWTQKVHLYRKDVYSVDFFYTYSVLWNQVETVEEEEIDVVNCNNLPDNVIFNLRWLIPLCLDDTTPNSLIIEDIKGN